MVPSTPMVETRRRRPKGEASREKILDAAAEIAGERGYEGTSINLISERSGLPASSIYWHFKDKDELVAAVIDRSFQQWSDTLGAPMDIAPNATASEMFHAIMRRTGAGIAEFPDYLRLGLMLMLERRPEELTARRRFLEVRRIAADRARTLYRVVFPDLGADDIETLVTLTMALSDGLFVAQEVGEVKLDDAFDMLATAILGSASELRGTANANPVLPATGR
ncbi:MAG TPA: TetR/AcrR family transcriptional regulator [Thermoplasmata archaeon]